MKQRFDPDDSRHGKVCLEAPRQRAHVVALGRFQFFGGDALLAQIEPTIQNLVLDAGLILGVTGRVDSQKTGIFVYR